MPTRHREELETVAGTYRGVVAGPPDLTLSMHARGLNYATIGKRVGVDKAVIHRNPTGERPHQGAAILLALESRAQRLLPAQSPMEARAKHPVAESAPASQSPSRTPNVRREGA